MTTDSFWLDRPNEVVNDPRPRPLLVIEGKPGAELIVAANILKVTIEDEPTLEVVDFIRNRYVR